MIKYFTAYQGMHNFGIKLGLWRPSDGSHKDGGRGGLKLDGFATPAEETEEGE